MKVLVQFGLQGETWGTGGAKTFDLPFFPTEGAILKVAGLDYGYARVHDAVWDLAKGEGVVRMKTRKVCGRPWETFEWANEELKKAGFTEKCVGGATPIDTAEFC